MNRTRSPTPWPTAFSRASSSAAGLSSVPMISVSSLTRRRRRPTARLTAIVPPPVPTSMTRSGDAPGGRGEDVNRRMTSASASSTTRSVSGRGIRARVSEAKASP